MFRLVRHPIFWSPLVAMALQLALVTVAAACTGGADFPLRR